MNTILSLGSLKKPVKIKSGHTVCDNLWCGLAKLED